jgi:hypothetical protein
MVIYSEARVHLMESKYMICNHRLSPLGLPGLLGLLWAACTPAAQAGDLTSDVAADYPRLEALFHHFHANPELSMQEFKTSDRMAAELEAEGYEVTRGFAKTGLAYASRARQVNLDGVDMPVMHACGHDMHITTLIGVARQLKARKADWRGASRRIAGRQAARSQDCSAPLSGHG